MRGAGNDQVIFAQVSRGCSQHPGLIEDAVRRYEVLLDHGGKVPDHPDPISHGMQ